MSRRRYDCSLFEKCYWKYCLLVVWCRNWCKVEKILKGSLDSIPSPLPSFESKKFVDNTQQCFAFTPQAKFPAHNLNFHWKWRWWVGIQAIYLNIFYFKKIFCRTCLPSKKMFNLLTLYSPSFLNTNSRSYTFVFVNNWNFF